MECLERGISLVVGRYSTHPMNLIKLSNFFILHSSIFQGIFIFINVGYYTVSYVISVFRIYIGLMVIMGIMNVEFFIKHRVNIVEFNQA